MKLQKSDVFSDMAINKNSLERRMQRISTEKLPTTSEFYPQARILCVGNSIVYRVMMNVAVHPIGGAANTESCHGKAQLSWDLVVSYTKLHQFLAKTSVLFNQPVMREIMTGRYQDSQRAFAHSMFGILNHYVHLNSVFMVHDDCKVMVHGRCYFEAFIADLWKSMELILPTIAVAMHFPGRLNDEIKQLHALLCDFLAVPEEKILQLCCVYTNAIISLKDIEVLLPKYMDQHCSICLESLLSMEPSQHFSLSEVRNAALLRDQQSSVTLSTKERSFSVKSPCGHAFHENCIMLWLRQSATCPECRAPIGEYEDQL